MSHEIYYTSAPEGLKRGSSGFSTVAASDNIPKPLWDRLETLSAYRHHFGAHVEGQVSSDGGMGGGAGRNPTSHAHWILTVTGKTYHVLSRICDSGVDHTQRTNAFAHHLVLDRAETEAAAGGPAWLLSQYGVMADAWDGRVGTLTRAQLPRGDGNAPRACHAWADATGDAGWGGHLADLFVKSPTRPVCILFSPGQELLPLIAETLALLPAPTRWNVTFNTYFTSMPTSATCLWRCCLAGTPAAQLGLRYAANGLVLDLTDRARLPAVPPSAYVAMARTGEGLQSTTPQAKSTAVKPPAKPAAPGKAGPGKSGTKFPGGQSPAIDPEDAADEARRDAIFDFADESGQAPSPEAVDIPAELSHLAGSFAAADAAATGPAPAAAASPARVAIPPRLIRHAEKAMQDAETDADHAAQRRRKQVMFLFIAALAAIGIGTGMVYVAYHNSVPRDNIPAPPSNNRVRVDPPKALPPPPEVSPEITPPPTQLPPVAIDPRPAPVPVAPTPAVPVPAAPVFPETVSPGVVLIRPNVGTGIGEASQSLALHAADLDPSARITSVLLHFPAGTRSSRGSGRASESDALYKTETLGTLTAEPRANQPAVVIRWKAPADTGPGSDVLTLAFERTGPALNVSWRLAPLLKKPELSGSLYWLLQNSRIDLQTTPPRPKPQQITFKPFTPVAASFIEPMVDIAWPAPLPKETAVTPPAAQTLPKGWEATWYMDWETKDAALRSPENATQVIKFKKSTDVPATDPFFVITFRPGFTRVESTFAKRLEGDQASLADAESKLRAITAKIDQAKAETGGNLGDSRGVKDALAEQEQDAKLVDAYKAAVAGYNELTHFDVAFDLPDGLRLTTLHFQRPAK